MFSIDIPPVPGTKAVYGNTPTGERLTQVDRRAELALHHARPQPGDVRRRIDLPGTHLQGVARRQGAGRDRPFRTRNLKQFSGAHALACPSENEIYAAETANWRVQKLLLQPQTQ